MHMPLIMKILVETLFRQRTLLSILERTFPATCIKFKVFTAIFSLHFTEIVFRSFSCSFSCSFSFSFALYTANTIHKSRRQPHSHKDSHTHTQQSSCIHSYLLYEMYCVFELCFVWFGSLVVAASPAPLCSAATVAATFHALRCFLSLTLYLSSSGFCSC